MQHFPGLALVIVLIATLAQTVKAGEIGFTELDQALHFYKPIEEMDASFHQIKYLKSMNLELKSDGSIHVHRPDLVTWQLTSPSPLRVKISKDQIEIESGEGATYSKRKFAASELGSENAARAINMIQPWLILSARDLSNRYKVVRVNDHQFEFTPKGQGMFAKISLTLAGDGHVETLTLAELSGDTMSLRFDKPKIVRRTP